MRHDYFPLTRFGNQASAVILSTIALTFAGCGLTKDHITINHIPMVGVERVRGADAVGVQVQVADARTNKENVGKKGSEYDFLGPIVPQADLAETIAKGIEAELLNRGFQVKEGAVVVFAELTKFYNDFKGFPEKAVAELIMSVQVKKPDGQIAFAKSITGQGINSGVMLRSGANAKVALDKALEDAVSKLFNDRAFIDALLKAGTQL
jgi:uncharacterized lipoprotein